MDDLISKMLAIDAVENCEPGEELFMIKSLPSIDTVPQWITCEERLPKHGEYVFVYLFGNNPYIAWYNEHIKRWDTDEFQIDEDEEPVAWMPLPKPYERKEE